MNQKFTAILEISEKEIKKGKDGEAKNALVELPQRKILQQTKNIF